MASNCVSKEAKKRRIKIVFTKKNTNISLVGEGKNGTDLVPHNGRRGEAGKALFPVHAGPSLSSSEAKNRAGGAQSGLLSPSRFS